MKTLALGCLIFNCCCVFVMTAIAIHETSGVTMGMLAALCFMAAYMAHQYEQERNKETK